MIMMLPEYKSLCVGSSGVSEQGGCGITDSTSQDGTCYCDGYCHYNDPPDCCSDIMEIGCYRECMLCIYIT